MSIDYLQSHFAFESAGPGIEVTPDGEYVFTTSPRVWDEQFKLWHLPTGRCVRAYEGNASVIKVLPDNNHFLVGNKRHEIEMRKRDGTCTKVFRGHKREVSQIEIAHDQQQFVSTDGYEIKVWSLETGECIKSFEDYGPRFALGPGNDLLVTGAKNESLGVWSLSTGELRCVLRGHRYGITAIAAMRRHPFAISAGVMESEIRYWDLDRGVCLGVLAGHTGPVMAVALSPEERFVLSGGDDCTLRLWRLDKLECVAVFSGHEKRVANVAIGPRGDFAISGSFDSTVRTWAIQDCKAFTFLRHALD